MDLIHGQSSSFATSNIVTVFVGSELTKFNLHKDLLCGSSPFFDACFNSSFREAETRELTLEDDDVEAFTAIVDWIYTSSIEKLRDASEAAGHGFCVLIKAYLLADKLGIYDYKNGIMDAICDYLGGKFSWGPTNNIPDDVLTLMASLEFPKSSPLFRLFVHRCAWELEGRPHHDPATDSLRPGYVTILDKKDGILQDILETIRVRRLVYKSGDPADEPKGTFYA